MHTEYFAAPEGVQYRPETVSQNEKLCKAKKADNVSVKVNVNVSGNVSGNVNDNDITSFLPHSRASKKTAWKTPCGCILYRFSACSFCGLPYQRTSCHQQAL